MGKTGRGREEGRREGEEGRREGGREEGKGKRKGKKGREWEEKGRQGGKRFILKREAIDKKRMGEEKRKKEGWGRKSS